MPSLFILQFENSMVPKISLLSYCFRNLTALAAQFLLETIWFFLAGIMILYQLWTLMSLIQKRFI